MSTVYSGLDIFLRSILRVQMNLQRCIDTHTNININININKLPLNKPIATLVAVLYISAVI